MAQIGQHRQNGGDGNEKELATRALQIQTKRFYLDVKQNTGGRFIKIAEVGGSGRRSRLLMSLATAEIFKNNLNNFIDIYSKLPAHAAGGSGDGAPSSGLVADGTHHSEQMVRDNRRYYLDLKENQRGIFLRVSMVTPSRRIQIAIPAQGMIELRNALNDLLAEFGNGGDAAGEGSGVGLINKLPDSKSLKVDGKMFYFDVGSNKRGVFMRISEVRSNFRTAITIPIKSWPGMRNIFSDLIDKLHSEEGNLEVEEKDEAVEIKGANKPVAAAEKEVNKPSTVAENKQANKPAAAVVATAVATDKGANKPAAAAAAVVATDKGANKPAAAAAAAVATDKGANKPAAAVAAAVATDKGANKPAANEKVVNKSAANDKGANKAPTATEKGTNKPAAAAGEPKQSPTATSVKPK